jgi:hypothetical protein
LALTDGILVRRHIGKRREHLGSVEAATERKTSTRPRVTLVVVTQAWGPRRIFWLRSLGVTTVAQPALRYPSDWPMAFQGLKRSALVAAITYNKTRPQKLVRSGLNILREPTNASAVCLVFGRPQPLGRTNVASERSRLSQRLRSFFGDWHRGRAT